MPVDFGPAAADYDRYRTGFPPRLFTELAALRVGVPGQRVVDLGTGTGILARGFAAAGCTVTGLDVSPELLDRARQRDTGAPITYQVAPAEDTGLPGGSWDVVSAAQCWHWFDRPRVIEEVRRLLVPGGALAICYRDYVSTPGSVPAASEELIVAHHPGWPLAGVEWSHPEWVDELARAGFGEVARVAFEVDVAFTHEAWRGRMRSSNGVAGSLSEAEVAAFDADLADLLRARFPSEPLVVPHRIWAIVARVS